MTIHQALHRAITQPAGLVRAEASQAAVRRLLLLCCCVISLVVFHAPVEALLRLAFDDERYTYTLAVPPISLALIWMRRGAIFSHVRYCPAIGLALALAGLTLFAMPGWWWHPTADFILSIGIFACILVCTGAFVGCYGTQVARACMFPMLFLLLAIPLPSGILDRIAVALQRASAESSYRLFKLTRVPVLRDGMFRFALPGATIEVAEECSGIRSSVSMFISSIVAGYLFLRCGWSRTGFALLTIPIVIFKNAVRIVTISWLGVYVDAGFFTGRLHHYGGLPFSLIALALLVPVLFLLVRLERSQ